MTHYSTTDDTVIGVHVGAALKRAANQYRTLWEAILEAIQNAIDAGAKKVNVNINQQTRTVFIHDDGEGASVIRMNKALRLVGDSLKKNRGKLGQFGIGVVASFGKCKRFIFTSVPIDRSNGPKRWTFDCARLSKVSGNSRIPCVDAVVDQWWNSELVIEDYTKDQLRSAIDFDEFCTAIYDRYNTHMLRAPKTTIHVKLKTPDGKEQKASLAPMNYAGEELQVRTYDGDLCGKTTIRMFTVQKPAGKRKKRKGRVKLMDSTGYTIPLSEKSMPLLTKKDVDTLTGGDLEGEIVFSEPVQVDPSRRFFIENEISLEAASHIELWLEKHGRALLKQIEDEATSARYERLASESLKVIRKLLQDNPNLKAMVDGFNWGHQGRSHAKNNAEKDGKVNAKSIDGSGSKTPSGTGRIRDPNKKPREKKGHSPMASGAGGRGNPRTFTRDASTGLLLLFVDTDKDLWTLDKERGIIRISTNHPTWVAHDRLDGSTQRVRNLMISHLQEKIILHVLTRLKLEQDYGEAAADIATHYAHEFVGNEHFLTTKADRLAGRGRFYKSAEASPAEKEKA